MTNQENVTPLPPEAMGLVAQLLQQNYNDYAATSQALIEGLMWDLAKRTAELKLVREGICGLLNSPYMPNPSYIQAELWPSVERIKGRAERDKPAE